MNTYIDQLKTYLSENTPNYGMKDIHSLLDFLQEAYTHFNPVDSDAIRAGIANLDPFLEALPFDANNALFDLISDLCLETERQAFRDGIHVGIRLAAELLQLPNTA